MIISRISLIGEPTVTLQIPHGGPEAPGLLVISGPNGSGKSLLTLALELAFARDDARKDLNAAVHAAGIQRIEVDLEHLGWGGKLSVSLPDGVRLIEWERTRAGNGAKGGASEHEDRLEGLPVGELFSGVNLVRSGQLTLPAFEIIKESVGRAMRAPFEAEQSRWCSIESELAGENGNGGRLGKVRELREKARAEFHRVEHMKQEFADARSRQTELLMRISDAAAQRDILSAEADELGKACVLAERATRLDIWVAEIRQESRTVQRLREQHSGLQESLDNLERKLRGAPDDFPSLLADFESMLQRQRELHERTSESRDRVERLKNELQDVDAQLQRLAAPDMNDLIVRRDRLGREIETANVQITDLLRGRTELVRQREGLEQHLRRKFQAFTELSPEDRSSLDQYFSPNGHSQSETVVHEAHPAQDPGPYETRAAAIQVTLRERFEGFELLPESTPSLLRELFDLRQIFATLSSDLEGLQARSANLRGRTRQSRSMVWSITAGVVGFGVATEVFAWDIGLFSGLVVSLFTLLAFQYSHRRIESEIESAVAAEAMTQRRYDTVRDSMSRLERTLKPIMHIPLLDVALMRLTEYESLIRELDDLESSMAEVRSTQASLHEVVKDDLMVVQRLPETLAQMPVPVLRQLHSEFTVLEQQLAELNTAWCNYADGGAYAEQTHTLEDRITHMHDEQSQIATEIERRNQSYLSQHNDMLERRSAIEEALNQSEGTVGSEGELSEIKERLSALDREVGGLLRNADLEALRAEWREREDLRTRLRETRDALSARPTHDELRARETLLSEELAQVKRRLLDLDPLYLLQGSSAEYASKYAGQLRALSDDIAAADEEIGKLQAEVNDLNIEGQAATQAAERPVEELSEQLADTQERFDAVERELGAVRKRIAALHKDLTTLGASVDHELFDAINAQIRVFSEERLQGVECRDDQWSAMAADGSVRALRSLSDGTCDLIYLAIRIAILEFLHGSDDSPVVWDEALSRLDERHLANVRVALVRLSSQRQVLLLTRHTTFEWWGPALRLTAPRHSVFDM